MPAGSIYMLEFSGTNIAPQTNPGVTISRAIGQADPTTVPTVQFAIDFSEPVTGFTPGDLQISGSAVSGGTPSIGLTQGSPFLGTNYVATISNFTQAGDVTLNIAAGAANAADDNAPTLAPTIIDNTIAFAFPTPQDLVFASDNFNVAPIANPTLIQGIATGTGWAGAWQNSNTAPTDSYKLGTASPMLPSNLRTLGNYAVGGYGYSAAFRALSTSAFGYFTALGSSPAAIGQNGTTLWMSCVLRKDTNDNAPVRVDLVNNTAVENFDRIDVGVGFYGGAISRNAGTRYWTLAVLRDNPTAGTPGIDYVRSNVPVVIGQPALLVLKMTFGATDHFDLFVNPSSLGGTAPATPNATFTTSGAQDILFRSVRFRAGLGYDYPNDGANNGVNKGSLDELRFGDTFAAVTPTLAPVELWRQQKFGSWQPTAASDDFADPEGDGIPNLLEYTFDSNPLVASPAALPQVGTTPTHLTFSFQRNLTATDLTYTVEGSPDLATWTNVAVKIGAGAWSTFDGAIVSDNGGSVLVTDGAPITAGRRFLRLRTSH
jgi:hypothetical protein